MDTITIDLNNILSLHEDALAEVNGWRWKFRFDTRVFSQIHEFVQEMETWGLDFYPINTSAYYCGCLTLEPWCKLGRDEPSIIRDLIDYHIKVSEWPSVLIEPHTALDASIQFVMNEKSPLHEFLVKNMNEWDDCLEESINLVIKQIAKAIEKFLEKLTSARYCKVGTWEQGMICLSCNTIHYDLRECPDCNKEMEVCA
jgi:hypothetical protein